MKVLGVQFSPLSIPRERRWQTWAVFFWMFTFMASTLFCLPWLLLAYILVYTRYWTLGLLYLAWQYHDLDTCNRGGRRGWLVRHVRGWALWGHFRDFFPITLVKTAELDPGRNYLLCSHPHGVLSAGAFCCFGTEGTGFSQEFPGISVHLLTLQQMFMIPFFRDLWYCTGATAATKEGMAHLLTTAGGGQAAVLVPGGAAEALNSDRGEVRLLLRERKGFVKMALRCGAALVPTFSFGEAGIYEKMRNPEGSVIRTVQNLCQAIAGFAPVFFVGRGIFQYSFGIVPHRKPITVVVGAPIRVKKVENPTVEDVEKLHAKYMRELERLYEAHNPHPHIKLFID